MFIANYDELGAGVHTLRIRGVDLQNVDTTPIGSWTIDTELPETRIITGPGSLAKPEALVFRSEIPREIRPNSMQQDTGTWSRARPTPGLV